MKKIVLVRHAESGWTGIFEKDIDRKLTERGRADASLMAQRIRTEHIFPEAYLSSNATRAQETANIFAETLGFSVENISIEKTLYEPEVKSFFDVIEGIPDQVNNVVLFSHNPGITEFIQILDLIPDVQMPPCGVFAFGIHTPHWKELSMAEKLVLFYDYPKGSI